MKVFLLISIAALLACKTTKQPVQPGQGLTGMVYRQSGNQMPATNRPARKLKGTPCSLYIYQPTTIQQTDGTAPVFTRVRSKIVTVIHTDSTGHYAVNLPAGKYSVFIKNGDQFFANESDGEGVLNPVAVMAGRLTTKDWKLAINAVN